MSYTERVGEYRPIELSTSGAVSGDSATVGPEAENDLFVFELANALLRHRKLIVRVPLLLTVVVVAITLIIPKKYTTNVSFAPAVSGVDLSQISGLAAQFGLSIPGSDPTQSPLFYADLIQSDPFLQQVAETRYTSVSGGDTISGNIIDLYEIDEKTHGEAVAEAIKLLNDKLVSVQTDRQTGIVSVSVTTKWPAISAEMGKRIVELLNDFNINSRQTQAAAQRQFVEQRADSALRELHASENAMQSFLLRNRAYQSDPSLVTEHDRIERELGLRQTVYTTLMQAYEQARVEAVRNTPSITIIGQPTPALRADRRHVIGKAVLGLFSGLVLVGGFIFIREYLSTGLESDSPVVREFSELKSAAWSDATRLFRRRPRRESAPGKS